MGESTKLTARRLMIKALVKASRFNMMASLPPVAVAQSPALMRDLQPPGYLKSPRGVRDRQH
jgi:hypothetical protein